MNATGPSEARVTFESDGTQMSFDARDVHVYESKPRMSLFAAMAAMMGMGAVSTTDRPHVRGFRLAPPAVHGRRVASRPNQLRRLRKAAVAQAKVRNAGKPKHEQEIENPTVWRWRLLTYARTNPKAFKQEYGFLP